MPKFLHIKDESKPYDKIFEDVPTGMLLTDFLRKQDLVNPKIYLNDQLLFSDEGEVIIDIDDSYRLKENDTILIVNTLKGAGIIVSAIATIAVSTAVTYALTSLIRPDIPTIPKQAVQEKGESQYSISTSQNTARNGQPIPECFGEFVRYPDLISAPYYRYHNNEEYLYMLMCVSKGYIDFANNFEVFIEDTPIESLNIGDVSILSTSPINGINNFTTSDINFLWTSFADDYVDKTTHEPASISIPPVSAPEVSYSLVRNSNPVAYFKMKFKVNFGGSVNYPGAIKNNYYFFITIRLFLSGAVQSQTQIVVKDKKFNTGENYEFYKVFNNTSNSYDEARIYFGEVLDGGNNGSINSITLKEFGYAETIDVSPDTFADDVCITAKEIENYKLSDNTKNRMSDIRLNQQDDPIDFIEVDIVLQGLFSQNSDGTLGNKTVDFKIIYTSDGGTTTEKLESITDNTRDIIRKTYRYQVFPSSYTIRVERITPESTDSKVQDDITVARLKGILKNTTDITKGTTKIDYGNTSLLMCRVKATNGVSKSGNFKIKVKANRKSADRLSPLKTAEEVIKHIYTDDNGGRQPAENLELPPMPESFNAVISRRTTVYQAMQSVATNNGYNLFPTFNKITARKDEPQPVRSVLYTDADIVEGSLKMTKTAREDTDYDGIRCKYLNADTFEEEFAIYPTDASYPKEINLDGITDFDRAVAKAKFLWKQGILRNIKYTFDLELDGNIPSLYDRIGITHSVLTDSLPNVVVAFKDNGNSAEITLKDAVRLEYVDDENLTHMVFRKRDGKPTSVYPIISLNNQTMIIDTSVTAIPDDIYVGLNERRTNVQLGKNSTFIRDIMVTKIKPKRDNIISLEGYNYTDDIYI